MGGTKNSNKTYINSARKSNNASRLPPTTSLMPHNIPPISDTGGDCDGGIEAEAAMEAEAEAEVGKKVVAMALVDYLLQLGLQL